MMKNFTTLLLSCLTLTCFAQGGKQTFLVSSDTTSPISYTRITAIDLHGGTKVIDIYDPQQKYAVRTNGLRNYLPLQQNAFINSKTGGLDTLRSPTGGAIACMAFDAKTNRLFYIPQYLSELRYMDLNQKDPSFTYLDNQSLNLLHAPNDVANQVTRMTIGADGFGYALTNDGEHLIKFTTDGTPVIQDLGVLVDKPSNKVFVRSSCSSWGGDMVSDANNNLYLVSQFNHMFKISLPSKEVEYMGYISNLPPAFTTNGVSVDENGDMILSCGSSLSRGIPPFYKISNWDYLQGVPLEEKVKGLGNISDMASSNLLFQKTVAATPAATNSVLLKTQEPQKLLPVYTVFPNPVSRGKFTIRTQNITDKGEYKMVIIDVTGRVVMEARMNLGTGSNTNTFTFPSQEAKGIYSLLVVDYFGRTVYSQQLIVE